MTNRAVFLDKDRTLVENSPHSMDIGCIRFAGSAFGCLQRLARGNYQFIIVTNQDGIAHGVFKEEDVMGVRRYIEKNFQDNALHLLDFYYCPHHPQGRIAEYAKECRCRKPLPGLIWQAQEEHDIDLDHSWVIGDILDDIECGKQAGCRAVLINNGKETEWRLTPSRVPDVTVKNLEEAAGAILGYPDE